MILFLQRINIREPMLENDFDTLKYVYFYA